jgi:TolB-like protein
LSYASQDAEAARRICEALRANGIEVWFDQSELRGGDAWDQKIRRQIRDCALFFPVISSNTQSRTEGYFRLEWHLADQRKLLMTKSRPFLVPVCVDATPDFDAEVPESFVAVQWTRLPGGETAPAFVTRISQLLFPGESHAPSEGQPPTGSSPSPRPYTPGAGVSRRSRLVPLLIAGMVIIGGSYLTLDHLTLSKRSPSPAPASAIASLPGQSAPSAILEKSVAVLPFINESSDKEQEYFADGLTDTMIDLLSRVPDLHVPARSSSFFFKGKSEELTTIAAKLHVMHVLEGSVRKAGNRLRVSAELIRADTGFHVWSESYDRDGKDVFKVQDEISAAVVAALKLRLVAAGINSKIRGTTNPEAYNQYLIGKHYADGLVSTDNLRRSTEALRKAFTLDQAYADAGAKLVLMEANLADSTGDAASLKRAIAAGERLPLEHPDHGPSYRIRGAIRQSWLSDWAGARADYEKALALDPTDGDAYFNESILLEGLGKFQEAIVAAQKSVAIDGLNLSYLGMLTDVQIALRDYAAADQTIGRMAEIDPRSEQLAFSLSYLRLLQGRYGESLAACPKITEERRRLACVARAQYSLGHRSEADQALAGLRKTGTGGNRTEVAEVYAWFGDADQAFAWFDQAVAARESDVQAILARRTLDRLHKDPRWIALLKKMNLPSEAESRFGVAVGS